MRFSPCLLLCLIAVPALSAPTTGDLRRIEQQIQQERQAGQDSARKAQALSGEVKSVQKQMVQLAQSVQQKEDDLTRLENRLKQLQDRQKEVEKSLALSDKQLVQVATGMQTLALRPPELALIDINTPVDTIRSRMLMGYSIPVVNGTARKMRQDLAELTQLRGELQEQIVLIKSAQSQLSEQSTQMDRLLQQKALMQAQYQASRAQSDERVKALAAQAKDIKELLDRLEAEKKKVAYNLARYQDKTAVSVPTPQPTPVATGAFARAKGRLPFPIRGTITEHFGQTTLGGAHTKGMTVSGRAQAHVIAPFDGTVLFAGPFKSYGELIILDHGDNYLTLLAGMDHVHLAVGQDVLAGEPVGQMKSTKSDLYVEIRQDGQAIDPEPWFSKQSE